jgi:hypothetical protein
MSSEGASFWLCTVKAGSKTLTAERFPAGGATSRSWGSAAATSFYAATASHASTSDALRSGGKTG